MKVLIMLFVAIPLVTLPVLAQPDTLWTRTYGGSEDEYVRFCAIQQTGNDGGYIIAVSTMSFGAGLFDFYLVRTNSQGDTIWTRTYGGSSDEHPMSIQRTTDGGYIVAGKTQSFGAGGLDVYVVKINDIGDTLWTRCYGGMWNDDAYSIQQTTDGGYIVAGYSASSGAGGNDLYLVKTDSQGNALWMRTYGGSGNDEAHSVLQTADGGYILVGYSASSGAGGNDLYLVKTDSQGNALWMRTYGGSGDDEAFSIQQTTDGGYIVAGYTASSGAGWYDFYLVKTNSLGDTLWTRTFGGYDWDVAYSVQQSADGGYIVAGETASFGAGAYDFYLVKTNSLGDTLWTRTYGGNVNDHARSIQLTADGGYIVAGETRSFGAGGSDVWLIKTASEQTPCPSTIIPFMCHFDSLALDTCWSWIREDTSLWSLIAEPGWMRILADGDLTGATNDAANILLRCVPDGDVRMETKLAFSPSVGQVVGAGLVIYHDDDNYLNIQQQPDHIRSHSEQDGQTSYFDYDQVWDLTYLRIEKIGSTYRTYASPDSLDWTLVATWEPEWTWDGALWVGLLSVGYVNPPVPADFDYFRVDSLSAASFPHPDTLWTRTYGGNGEDCGYSVQLTDDGGFIVAGTTESFGAGSADYHLVKTNSQGDTLWTRTYGGSGFDEARSVQQTDDGGYIVAGRTYSFGAGNRDFYLVKTNSLGDTLWTRTYGGSEDDWASSVQQTADGGYVVSGTTSSFGAGQGDIYLVKTDVQGDTLWTRTIGGGYTDEGYEIRQLSDGGYVIAATTRSFGAGNWDYYLVRTDADGEVVWTRTFGGGAGDGGRSVEQTSDGGFIMAGWSCSFSGYYDAYLVKTDANGSTDWDRTYGGWDIDQSEWARQTFDGGFISVGGTTTFGAGDWDVYLVRTDSHGDALWTTTYGGGGTDRGWALEVASDGGYIVTGQTGSFGAGGSDVYLIRLAPEQTVIADVPHVPLPQELVLRQNYPNPFNPMTTIAFDLPKAGHISLRVFDLLGREVAVLKDGSVEAGTHRVMFDGSNLASGIYFARLETGEFVQTKKLMLLK